MFKNTSPQQLDEELKKYFHHILDRDPNKLEFTVMVAGYDKGNGDTDICSMIGGPPPLLAAAVMALMNKLIERNPALLISFMASMLHHIHSQDLGGFEVETRVRNLLSKFQKQEH